MEAGRGQRSKYRRTQLLSRQVWNSLAGLLLPSSLIAVCLPISVRASQCVLLRNSTMKLIHPTAIVTMPIAMQRSDAVQIVPATIQTTPAKMIARETRYSRTLPLITRYAWPEPDLNRQTTPAATATAVTQQTASISCLRQHTMKSVTWRGGELPARDRKPRASGSLP